PPAVVEGQAVATLAVLLVAHRHHPRGTGTRPMAILTIESFPPLGTQETGLEMVGVIQLDRARIRLAGRGVGDRQPAAAGQRHREIRVPFGKDGDAPGESWSAAPFHLEVSVTGDAGRVAHRGQLLLSPVLEVTVGAV